MDSKGTSGDREIVILPRHTVDLYEWIAREPVVIEECVAREPVVIEECVARVPDSLERWQFH